MKITSQNQKIALSWHTCWAEIFSIILWPNVEEQGETTDAKDYRTTEEREHWHKHAHKAREKKFEYQLEEQ